MLCFSDAKTDEYLEMKVFNHDFKASDSEMVAMLKKANLEGHGYKKEVSTKVVQEADGGQEYQVCHSVCCAYSFKLMQNSGRIYKTLSFS